MANKINLLGANNELLSKAKVEQKQAKTVFVPLPDSGVTELQLFTQYQITTDKIGSGSFASIKVVKEHATGKHFALKYVKTRGRPLIDINAFRKEILFLSKLKNHPNIIKLYDFCVCQNGLYMVLEFCNGGDVKKQLEKNQRLHESEAKHIIKQVVAGICYFHQHNIVHRDLKPDNLMYNNGVIKIIDFGLADDCSNNALTQSCGTALYAAPEVICGTPYNTKADMWSLGIILFQLIAGHFPFFDKNQNKLMELVKTGKFSFSCYFDSCHPSLRSLISKLLCLQTSQRLSAQQARNDSWFSAQCKKKPAVNHARSVPPQQMNRNNKVMQRNNVQRNNVQGNNANNKWNANNNRNMRPQSRSLYNQQPPQMQHKAPSSQPYRNNNNHVNNNNMHNNYNMNNNNNMNRNNRNNMNMNRKAPMQSNKPMFKQNNMMNINRRAPQQNGFNPNMNINKQMPQKPMPQAPYQQNANRNHSYSVGSNNNEFQRNMNQNMNGRNTNQYKQTNYNQMNSNPHNQYPRTQQQNNNVPINYTNKPPVQKHTNNANAIRLPQAQQLNMFK